MAQVMQKVDPKEVVPVGNNMVGPHFGREPKEAPSVPGSGIAGKVICPYLSIPGRDVPCCKSGCEMWIELKYGDKWVGRCAWAYQAIIMVEMREAIDRLNAALAPKENSEAGTKKTK